MANVTYALDEIDELLNENNQFRLCMLLLMIKNHKSL